MKNVPSNGTNQNVLNSQKTAAAKEETAYEAALRKEGIDEVFIAKKLKSLAQAQGQRWNPKKGSWEKFEDYGTQLAASREIAKILGLYSGDSSAPQRIDISAIPMTRERVQSNDE